MQDNRNRIGGLALKSRLPATYSRRVDVEAGLVSLVVVENRFFGIGVQIFLPQLPYKERSLNSQRLSIPPSRGFQR